MRPVMIGTRRLALSVILLGSLCGVASAGNTFRRDLKGFFAFANRQMRLKNFTLSDACNVGVNCQRPATSSECGTLTTEDIQFADGSQIGADGVFITQPGASVWEVFRNFGSVIPPGTIRHPGMQPDGTDLLSPLPIIGDLDGDGHPSCGTGCVTDPGDLEVACGFPNPFPSCDPSKPVSVSPNADCSGAPDATPGNGRCDLAPGVYGDLVVSDFSKIDFLGGNYVFCSVSIGKNTTSLADAPTVIDVPSGGFMNVSNESSFGQKCGDFAVQLKGQSPVNFGRNAVIAAAVCAPSAIVSLGHNNQLTGQFVGDIVFSDQDNVGHCCAGGTCTCFDSFSPTSAHVGDTVTLTSMCDLTSATKVKICDIDAVVTVKSASEIKATVPAGATGSCTVKVESAAGVFTAVGTLTILP